MKKIVLEIPAMQSAHCQARVRNAVDSVAGAAITSSAPGRIEVSLSATATESQVRAAVTAAGYAVAGGAQTPQLLQGNLFRFKTNIHCGGCVAKVTPGLNAVNGIEGWEVDTLHPDKVLTVQSSGAAQTQIIEAVQAAGYSIETI